MEIECGKTRYPPVFIVFLRNIGGHSREKHIFATTAELAAQGMEDDITDLEEERLDKASKYYYTHVQYVL